MFSVCVLCYGDYPHLARRCLSSVVASADWNLVKELRIGANAISDATREAIVTATAAVPVRVTLFGEASNGNIFKYPMMRAMLYGEDADLLGRRIMWFDDDSFVRPESGLSWWQEAAVLGNEPAVVGSVYRLPKSWRPGQREGIVSQKWYAGVPLDVPVFVTGGWWHAEAAFLAKHDYPFPELLNNNGDVLLGELCRQQGVLLRHYNKGIAINADEAGHESRSPRRGAVTAWPWQKDSPAVTVGPVKIVRCELKGKT